MGQSAAALVDTRGLFEPLTVNGLTLGNRFAMAPMTRHFAPNGILNSDVAPYYKRRAAGGVGLIITEGTFPDHPVSHYEDNCPIFYGAESLSHWKHVVDEVHSAGSKIFVQLWHAGLARKTYKLPNSNVASVAPSGDHNGAIQIENWDMGYKPNDGLSRPVRPMSQKDVDDVIDSFATAAVAAKEIGFDGINIHAAHGYLIDLFFWDRTNFRSDQYGGNIRERTRFAVDLIAEMRRRVGSSYPLMLRFSQWKNADYSAKMFATPKDLEQFLQPLSEAGIDIFDASTRRFWLPEFEEGPMNLAGWAKRITGKCSMTVGSLGLDAPLASNDVFGEQQFAISAAHVDDLIQMFDRGDFDLVALGRALLANPDWPNKIRSGDLASLQPYRPAHSRRALD